MEELKQKADEGTKEKYLALIALISSIEKRLGYSELIYLTLNLAVTFFTISFISSIYQKTDYIMTAADLFFVLFCLVIGMAICTYWAAFAMRLQLKLKLRYFQARFLERKMDKIGENIFSDESPFFKLSVGVLESPDKKETILYQTPGVTGMDGFIGAPQPRFFSLVMPLMFFLIYLIIFLLMFIKFFG